MEKLVRLTAATLFAAILFCSCGEVKIESITLSKNAAELKEGESVTLSAVVAPENATEHFEPPSLSPCVNHCLVRSQHASLYILIILNQNALCACNLFLNFCRNSHLFF